MSLNGPYQPPLSGGPARQAVILLHGYGADGHDLIDLAPLLATALPEAAFYAPHAPAPCEIAPFGRQWFSLADYDPDMMRRSPATMGPALERMLAGAGWAAPDLLGFLDDVRVREGVDNRHLALVGFSQGTMMALHVALRLLPPLAGVVGFSGALVGADALARDLVARPPVLLVHGEADPVVPFPAMERALVALRDAGIAVEAHGRPGLEHGIDDGGLALAMAFLRRVLGVEDDVAT